MPDLAKVLTRFLPAIRARTTAPNVPDDADASDDLGLYDDTLSGWYQNATDEVFRGIPIGPQDIVVDVGCGGGGSSFFCAKRGAYVAAIDQDLQVAREVRSKLSKLAPHSHAALVADAHQLPLSDGFATRIVCTEVLEHVDNPGRVLGELFRIGKPGAQYLLSVPGCVQENLQKHIAPPIYFQKPNHVRIFTEQQFVNLVADNGLIIEDQVQYGFYHSIWLALFWACEVAISRPDHPALHHWTESWRAILGTRSGPELKKQLDAFLPRTQVIVARKP
jgi:ubiquinone/menaquinone biosynthesis C-methylase UbiE